MHDDTPPNDQPTSASRNGTTASLAFAHVAVNGQAEPLASSYLQYLPAPYQGDPFLGRFLMIFESILGPIERMVDTLPSYFDPRLTPEELLPWLASWVNQELDENWPLARRRELAAQAATLHRWRGTRRGLREHLRLYTGHTPLIVENFDGLRLGQDAALGVNTRLGERRPHTIAVTVLADQVEDVDEQVLYRIIESEKPAHVGYTLEVRALGEAFPPPGGPSDGASPDDPLSGSPAVARDGESEADSRSDQPRTASGMAAREIS